MNSLGTGAVIAGRYELRAVTGHGGMGTVWLARDTLLDRDVAIKEIIWPPQLGGADREALKARALREARMAARLNHPNIVGVYDVAQADGRPWIVMQFLPYRSLGDAVREDGPMTPARVAQAGLQILAAIRAAHAAGVLHRDIKPGNVLLGPDGRAVLTDFGIAVADGSSTLTTGGVLIGSPSYMAPERARGEQATEAADLWSLGATLYAAVEGRPPFDREGTIPVLHAVVNDDLDPPSRAGPLWPVISALLSKDPRARPTAADVQRVLTHVAAGDDDTQATMPVGPARPALIPGLPLRGAGPPGSGELQARPGDADRAGRPPAAAGYPVADGAATRAAGGPVADGPAARTSGGRRASSLLAVAAGFALLAVIAVVAALLVGSHPSRQVAQPGRSQTPAGRRSAPPSHRHRHASSSPRQHSPAAASPTPASSAAPSGAPPPQTAPPSPPGAAGALPAGYTRYHDPTGFSIGVPEGWQVSRQGHLVYITDPGTGMFLLVDQTTHPRPDPLTDWRQQEAARIGTYPGYHRIRLQAVHYAQAQRAADWEFTYYRSGQLVHVLNRNVLVNAHHAYALYWSTPANLWDSAHHFFAAFAATFRPAGGRQGS